MSFCSIICLRTGAREFVHKNYIEGKKTKMKNKVIKGLVALGLSFAGLVALNGEVYAQTSISPDRVEVRPPGSVHGGSGCPTAQCNMPGGNAFIIDIEFE